MLTLANAGLDAIRRFGDVYGDWTARAGFRNGFVLVLVGAAVIAAAKIELLSNPPPAAAAGLSLAVVIGVIIFASGAAAMTLERFFAGLAIFLAFTVAGLFLIDPNWFHDHIWRFIR